MKNEAYKSGQACAEKYKQQIIAVSEQFYRDQAQQYAHGHFSTSKAQEHFVEGWMSVPPPIFVEGERVTLLVNIMNIAGLVEVLTKKMRELFIPYGHSSIELVKTSKICLTFRLETEMAVLNWQAQSAFLKHRYINYKLALQEAKNV